jgi:hypothetical protein
VGRRFPILYRDFVVLRLVFREYGLSNPLRK